MNEDIKLLNELREKDRKIQQRKELKKMTSSILSIIFFPIIFLFMIIYFAGKKYK